MFDDNQISDLMNSAMEKIKKIIDVNTVVGTPFETKDGVVLIPLTKVSIGFVVGGGEYCCDKKIVKETSKMPFAGGTGGGVSMHPIGLLQVKDKSCKLIRIDEKTPYEKILEKIPDIIDSISPILKKEDKDE